MKKFRVLALALIALLVIPLSACNMSTDKLVEKTQYGVVEVSNLSKVGSGFIAEMNEEGCTIITNYHIISNENDLSEKVQIRFFDSDTFVSADLVGYSQDYDIAVLHTSALPQKSYVFKFAAEPKVGQEVVSIGFVQSNISAYSGIVSSKDKLVNTANYNGYLTEVSAAAPLGTSGGACVNLKGNVIGLNAFNYMSIDGLLSGVSYKVPSSIVSAVYQRIKDSDNEISAISLGFMFFQDGDIIVNCLNNVHVSYKYGVLMVVSSSDSKLTAGKGITSVNGKDATLMTFLSQIILTLDKTEFSQS